MKKIIHTTLLLTVGLFVWGCAHTSPNDEIIHAELSLITDSTLTINVYSCSVDEYCISKLIDSVRYVSLEYSDSALIGVVKNIKLTKDLIYVLDLQNDNLKCFNIKGKFIRKACQIGGGPEEISHLIDFDVDEDFLYVLDGAKVAIQIFDHDGNYIKKANLPFRAHKIKCISNNSFLFELSPYDVNGNNNSNVVVYTNDEFKPINYYLNNIEGASVGVAFENQFNSTYFSSMYGNGIYERKDSLFFMKYYIDFGGKYFNRDKQGDGFREAIEQGLYFTSYAPLHNDKYLIRAYYAGLKRHGVLLVDLNNNKTLFLKTLIQDRPDLIDFNFGYTMGFDALNSEFYGICNYIDLSSILSNKEDAIYALKKQIPKEAQTSLLQEDAARDVNQILLFYKLKDSIDFESLLSGKTFKR